MSKGKRIYEALKGLNEICKDIYGESKYYDKLSEIILLPKNDYDLVHAKGDIVNPLNKRGSMFFQRNTNDATLIFVARDEVNQPKWLFPFLHEYGHYLQDPRKDIIDKPPDLIHKMEIEASELVGATGKMECPHIEDGMSEYDKIQNNYLWEIKYIFF